MPTAGSPAKEAKGSFKAKKEAEADASFKGKGPPADVADLTATI